MPFGRMLMVAGAVLFVLGVLFSLSAGRGPVPGRLPGDVVYRKGNVTFYFPIVTSVVLSILLTLIFRFFRR